jgi:hypothetical protein
VVSANLVRRDMTKGQKAMALAMIYPDPAKLKRSGGGSVASTEHGVSAERLSHARTVLKHNYSPTSAVRRAMAVRTGAGNLLRASGRPGS